MSRNATTRAVVLLGIAAVAVVGAVARGQHPGRLPEFVPQPSASPSATSVGTGSPAAGQAINRLSHLGVVNSQSAGYRRSAFGPPWADTNDNGCDTRDDVLTRDLTHRRYRQGTRDCVVIAGQLRDPYTGASMAFSKARATEVQIDHVVSLGDAWASGAARWTASRRLAFANDMRNLLAVDGKNNESKGDKDAAAWLPPNAAEQCDYVVRQIEVKASYGLTVTRVERSAMLHVLRSCRHG